MRRFINANASRALPANIFETSISSISLSDITPVGMPRWNLEILTQLRQQLTEAADGQQRSAVAKDESAIGSGSQTIRRSAGKAAGVEAADFDASRFCPVATDLAPHFLSAAILRFATSRQTNIRLLKRQQHGESSIEPVVYELGEYATPQARIGQILLAAFSSRICPVGIVCLNLLCIDKFP